MARGVVLNNGLYGADGEPPIWSFLYTTIYHKITAALTAILFLFSIVGPELAEAARTNLSSAIASSASEARVTKQSIKQLDVESFQIPDKLGSLKDKHAGTGGTIIFVQDAHCNLAAQNAISKIIEHLNEEYGVTLINLEGGSGEYDLSLFTDIEDKDTRKRVSEYFMEEGRVSGPEHFAINNTGKVTLYGVEDEDLYVKNLDVYRESLEYVSDVNNTLDYAASRADDLKNRLYPEHFLELDKEYGKFKNNELDLKDFIERLFLLSLDKGLSLKEFSNVRAIYEAITKERQIDFKRANSERDRLVEELKEIVSLNTMDELTLKTFLFRSGQLSQGAYYRYLSALAKENDLDLSEKPNLSNYVIYINLYEGADKLEVFNEIDSLFSIIAEKDLENESQMDLFRVSKHIRILKNIFNIKATRNELKYFNANKHEISISHILDFIRGLSAEIDASPTFDNSAKLLDEKRDRMLGFYKYALARDEGFLANIQKSHKRFKKDASILVAGGFHTENMTTLLKKRGLSYVVIRPTFISPEDYKCPYYKLLSGGLSDLEETVVAAVSAIALASAFTPLFDRVHDTQSAKASREVLRTAVAVCRMVIFERKSCLVKTGRSTFVRFSIENGDIVARNVDAEKAGDPDWTTDATLLASLSDKLERAGEEGAAITKAPADVKGVSMFASIRNAIREFRESRRETATEAPRETVAPAEIVKKPSTRQAEPVYVSATSTASETELLPFKVSYHEDFVMPEIKDRENKEEDYGWKLIQSIKKQIAEVMVPNADNIKKAQQQSARTLETVDKSVEHGDYNGKTAHAFKIGLFDQNRMFVIAICSNMVIDELVIGRVSLNSNEAHSIPFYDAFKKWKRPVAVDRADVILDRRLFPENNEEHADRAAEYNQEFFNVKEVLCRSDMIKRIIEMGRNHELKTIAEHLSRQEASIITAVPNFDARIDRAAARYVINVMIVNPQDTGAVTAKTQAEVEQLLGGRECSEEDKKTLRAVFERAPLVRARIMELALEEFKLDSPTACSNIAYAFMELVVRGFRCRGLAGEFLQAYSQWVQEHVESVAEIEELKKEALIEAARTHFMINGEGMTEGYWSEFVGSPEALFKSLGAANMPEIMEGGSKALAAHYARKEAEAKGIAAGTSTASEFEPTVETVKHEKINRL
ncbi:MAG: hypothetical protein ABH875_02050, partial [Candidatus Omnitrophota bacterium]